MNEAIETAHLADIETRTGDAKPRAKILVLASDAYGGFGGISQYVRDLIEALDGIDWIESIHAIPRIAEKPYGVMPAKLHFDDSGLGGIVRFSLAALLKGLFGPRPDMVICCHINLMPIARVVAAVRRVPLILFVYGIDVWDQPQRKFVTQSSHASDMVVSISNVTLERMKSWCTIAPGRSTLLPNAIHLDQFGVGPKAADLIDKYGLLGKRVLMTVGRMVSHERMKGFDELIAAMPALLARAPDLVYMVVGKGPDRERLEGLVSGLGLQDHVIFTGMIDEDRKADHYRLADVFAMPSGGEGFGFVFLEAMACGVPVITGRFDGGYEAILNGAIGVAVDPASQDEIVEAILSRIDESKHIPERLSEFSFPSFQKRLEVIIGNVWKNR